MLTRAAGERSERSFSSQLRYVFHFCCYCLMTKLSPTLCGPWAVARQAPLPIGFPKREYCSGLHLSPAEAEQDGGGCLASPGFDHPYFMENRFCPRQRDKGSHQELCRQRLRTPYTNPTGASKEPQPRSHVPRPHSRKSSAH